MSQNETQWAREDRDKVPSAGKITRIEWGANFPIKSEQKTYNHNHKKKKILTLDKLNSYKNCSFKSE